MNKKISVNKVLAAVIAAPIVVALLVGGAPAIWQGIVAVAKAIFPNFWVVLAYAYIALIAFLVGLKRGSKSKGESKK